MIIFYHFLNETFLFWNSMKSVKCSNKSNRFHLKMESDEETAAAIVALLLVKRNKKREKDPCE